MDRYSRQRLVALKAHVKDRAVIVGNYADDDKVVNSIGEKRNATYIAAALWDISKIIEILLEAETK